MQVFTMPDGSTQDGTQQLQIGNQKYPAGWLLTAPAAELATIGVTMTTQPDPVQPPPQPTSVQVNSTSTPTLNGVYAIDPSSTANITAETLFIAETTTQSVGTFTNGQTTRSWPDTSGVMHTFTIPQFIAFAEAIAKYVDSVVSAAQAAQATQTTPTWPAGPLMIA